MKKVSPKRVQIHVAHACNLTCESCSHYSNHGHVGMLSVEDAERQMAAWSPRVEPELFSLMGGEPTVNPALTEITAIAVKHFPRIEVVSNGFFLYRHPRLGEVMAKAEYCHLALSEHASDPDYREKFEESVAVAKFWQGRYGISVRIRRYDGSSKKHNWTRRYHGYGPTMMPYTDEQPRKSWEVCNAKFCMQLHEGRLWKCPAIAYLPMQKARWPELSPAWDLGLAYKALDPSCSDDELRAFVAREDENTCTLCPSETKPFTPAHSPMVPARELLRMVS